MKTNHGFHILLATDEVSDIPSYARQAPFESGYLSSQALIQSLQGILISEILEPETRVRSLEGHLDEIISGTQPLPLEVER